MINKVIDIFSRVFIGVLFIFSGLVKLNDPVGTQIKLEEYFTVFADSFAGFFSWFIPFALPIALLLIVLEIVLGVAVLIQYRMKRTTVVLLALMIFFIALTFFSAYTGKVTDCGCFGDAIPLTPWESFYKDVILMVFVLHLFWHRKRLQPLSSLRVGRIVLSTATILSLAVGWYAIAHLPFIDFRPYKVGNNIPEKMLPDEDPVLEYVFVKDGKEVVSDKFLSKDQGYKYKEVRILNEKASTPRITDYQVVDPDGNDITEQTLQGRVLLLVFQDINEADLDNMDAINTLVEEAKDVNLMVITSSNPEDFETFRHKYQLAVPYYFVDATVLKAMIRSNPGIMYLKDGWILGKWHENDVPDISTIHELG